ncbi:hypothetical protein [Paraburkholderia bonniea]|uniref:hypothetical protein n=1 Tax=Paraburkholderia bonniea TaxID=2152891 RepID=UPI001290ADC7|nr:hypothetical protein [Paraburkholderia bonniea]
MKASNVSGVSGKIIFSGGVSSPNKNQVRSNNSGYSIDLNSDASSSSKAGDYFQIFCGEKSLNRSYTPLSQFELVKGRPLIGGSPPRKDDFCHGTECAIDFARYIENFPALTNQAIAGIVEKIELANTGKPGTWDVHIDSWFEKFARVFCESFCYEFFNEEEIPRLQIYGMAQNFHSAGKNGQLVLKTAEFLAFIIHFVNDADRQGKIVKDKMNAIPFLKNVPPDLENFHDLLAYIKDIIKKTRGSCQEEDRAISHWRVKIPGPALTASFKSLFASGNAAYAGYPVFVKLLRQFMDGKNGGNGYDTLGKMNDLRQEIEKIIDNMIIPHFSTDELKKAINTQFAECDALNSIFDRKIMQIAQSMSAAAAYIYLKYIKSGPFNNLIIYSHPEKFIKKAAAQLQCEVAAAVKR